MIDPLEALDGTPWRAVYDRMAAAIEGLPGEDYTQLPAGKHETVMERWSRLAAASGNPELSISLTLPLAMTAMSTATQGGIWMRIKQPNGSVLPVPCIFQGTVIAPSGYGKSAVLGPLVDILDKLNKQGVQRRRAMIMERQAAVLVAMNEGKPGKAPEIFDEGRVRKIFGAGLCPEITLDQGTPEGIRDALLAGGGTSGILTAEPDVLREISAYAKDGGTFRWMLDGWNGDRISIARATGRVIVERTCLPYCIVVQPIAFDMFNRAARGQEEGVAADSAVGRGLYGRSWLIRISEFSSAGAFGVTGSAAAGLGALTDVAAAQMQFAGVLDALVQKTDAYRAGAGIAMAWRNALSAGMDEGMPGQDMPDPVWMELKDAAAGVEYMGAQNLRLALINLVKSLETERVGSERLYLPMITRITQHILRIAMMLALSDGLSEVPAWAVRDAGSRIVPWLFGQWCTEMRAYAESATLQMQEAEVRRNPRGIDLTPVGTMKRAISLMVREVDVSDDMDVSIRINKNDAIKRALAMHSSAGRNELTPIHKEAFEQIVAKGWLAEVAIPRADGKPGRPMIRYELTALGKVNGLS